MNHTKATQKEIADYLNAVRKSMQGSPEEEIDEVILHLQEQINVALQESGEAADQADAIREVLSAMSPPESFAVAKDAKPRESRKGVVALTLAVISLLFALFLIHPLFLLPVLTPAIVLAVISRKTVPGKVAIALLIVIPIWYAVITPVYMVPKKQEDRARQSGHRSVESAIVGQVI